MWSPLGKHKKEELKIAMIMPSLLRLAITLDERCLNLATGLVESRPADIYLMTEALADAGVGLGLPKMFQ